MVSYKENRIRKGSPVVHSTNCANKQKKLKEQRKTQNTEQEGIEIEKNEFKMLTIRPNERTNSMFRYFCLWGLCITMHWLHSLFDAWLQYFWDARQQQPSDGEKKGIGWWNENYVIMYDKQNMCMFRCYLISGVENCSGWDVWAGWTLNTWAFCRCSRLTLLLFGARFDLIVVITIPFFCSLASYLFLNSLRHSFAPRQFFFPFLYNVNLRSLSDLHYIWEATCSQAVWRKISCSAIPHCASLYFDALVLYSFCSSGRFYRSLCILTLLFCSRILLYISLSLSISYWFVFVEFVRFYYISIFFV